LTDDSEVIDVLQDSEPLKPAVSARSAFLAFLQLAPADDRSRPVHRSLKENQPVKSELFEKRFGFRMRQGFRRILRHALGTVFERVGEQIGMISFLAVPDGFEFANVHIASRMPAANSIVRIGAFFGEELAQRAIAEFPLECRDFLERLRIVLVGFLRLFVAEKAPPLVEVQKYPTEFEPGQRLPEGLLTQTVGIRSVEQFLLYVGVLRQ
jgi:hypothetical protein